ncbi:hypothetical protein Pcinc_015102 [Petrolisthes cinctipes]|uniref:Uncharacterized protein n=1 Tax=Petrolisthes cinctipes TaxID=88211 RepID=A0AAE1KQ42_PETCI|nr:hypothetical protein Pcinc_015102 [Petrolisthes cinctipes]
MICFVLGSSCVSWSFFGQSCQISDLGPADLDLTEESCTVYGYKLYWPCESFQRQRQPGGSCVARPHGLQHEMITGSGQRDRR